MIGASQGLQLTSALRFLAGHASRPSPCPTANDDPLCQCDFPPCAADTACTLAGDATRLASNPPPCTACPARNPACSASRLAGRPSRLSLRFSHSTPPWLFTAFSRVREALPVVEESLSCVKLRFSAGLHVLIERDYAVATFAATLVATKFLMRRRVRSTNASLSARQLSSRTPTA
jgi:hypothetical protein